MNAKEKYEIIVKTIEKLIKANELADQEISDKAFDCAGMATTDNRERNNIFDYLMGKQVRTYILDRKRMIAYKYLINEKDDKMAVLVAKKLLNASDQYFVTIFKDRFGMTPKTARKRKDPSLYEYIPTWEYLSGMAEGDDSMENTIFDIPRKQFLIIQKVLNLKDFYDFNEYESEFAYSIYKNDKTDLEKAFEYVADYMGLRSSEKPDDRLETDLGRDDVKYLYFTHDFGFDEIFRVLLMKYLKQFHNPIKSYDERFLKACADYAECLWTRWDPSEPIFQDKYDYYFQSITDQYTDLDFELYTLYLQFYDYKKAFSKIVPGLEDRAVLRDIKARYHKESPYISREDQEYFDKYQIEMESEYYSYADVPEDGYEPEVWDDDFSSEGHDASNEGILADEDEWVASETKSYDSELNLDIDESEYNEFDLEAFDQLCDEMDETQEETQTVKRKNKRFFFFNDLDVESCGKYLMEGFPGLPFK